MDAWPLLVGLLALAALATWGLRRLVARRRSAPRPPPGPVEVPPEEIELGEAPVSACLQCGSPHLRQPRVSEGLIPGVGDGLRWACGRCGWQGQPLTFDDPTAYRQFVKGLHENEKAEA